MPLPPGPSSKLVQTFKFVKEPLMLQLEYAKRYGDPFTLPIASGTWVITGKSEAIQQIFAADPDMFDSAAGPASPLLGHESLLLVSGARHRRQRKLLMPPFIGARMQAYGSIIQQITVEHLANWQPGQQVDVLETMQSLSLAVILRAVFGLQDPAQVKAFGDAVVANTGAFSPALTLFSFLRHDFGGWGPWARFQKTLDHLVGLLLREIQQRRQETVERQDILSLLLAVRDEDGSQLTDSEMVDQLRTLLFAGHETTAVSLTWACYELARHPEIEARLRAELSTLSPDAPPTELSRLPYLSAVCKETLRLHPVVPHSIRRLNRPWTFQGYELPAGTDIAFSLALTHFNEQTYPEPLSFKPERFLDRNYSQTEYLPYGGGVRRCLGASFADFEMRIALGTLLQRHRLESVSDKPLRTGFRHFTLGPDGGLKMRCVAVPGETREAA